MALETPDRMHAAAVIIHSAAGELMELRSVGMQESQIFRKGPGIQKVRLLEGLAVGEWHASINVVRTVAPATDAVATMASVQRQSDTEFEIQTWDSDGVLVSADEISLAFFRISQGVGT